MIYPDRFTDISEGHAVFLIIIEVIEDITLSSIKRFHRILSYEYLPILFKKLFLAKDFSGNVFFCERLKLVITGENIYILPIDI
jgi:hypothetical protein